MVEFFNRNIIKKGVIYDNKLLLQNNINDTHISLIENEIQYSIKTHEIYVDFINTVNPIYINILKDNIIIYSSKHPISIFNLINILKEHNISITDLYVQHEFDQSLDSSTFSKINYKEMLVK